MYLVSISPPAAAAFLFNEPLTKRSMMMVLLAIAEDTVEAIVTVTWQPVATVAAAVSRPVAGVPETVTTEYLPVAVFNAVVTAFEQEPA